MNTVFIKEYTPPSINRNEILRYMGCKKSNTQTEMLVNKSLAFCIDNFSYKVCFAEFNVNISDSVCDLGFGKTVSKDLAKNLADCKKVIIFAATIGLELDRLILRHGKTEPSVALCLQAIGAERIEVLCDTFCKEIKEEYAQKGKNLRPRFSAGYGDLSIDFQKEIFNVLDCAKHIGLTLNDSLVMSPSKSVTAIIGIY